MMTLNLQHFNLFLRLRRIMQKNEKKNFIFKISEANDVQMLGINQYTGLAKCWAKF